MQVCAPSVGVLKQYFQFELYENCVYPTIIYYLTNKQDTKQFVIFILINVRLLKGSGFYGYVRVYVNIIPFLSTSLFSLFCSILIYLFQSTVRFQLSDLMEYLQ